MLWLSLLSNSNKNGDKLLRLVLPQWLTTICHAIQHVAYVLGCRSLQFRHKSWQQLLLQHRLVLLPDSCWCLAQRVQHISDMAWWFVWHQWQVLLQAGFICLWMPALQPRQLHNGCSQVDGVHAAHMLLDQCLHLLC
jgi:hypothetical protein